MKNILLAIDLKEKTSYLVNYAAEFARNFNAKLWIVHITAPDPDFVGYEVGPQYIRDEKANKLRKEHLQLQTIAASLNKKGIHSEAILIQGPTVKTILEEAKKLDVKMLMTGTHEHGLIFNVFFESISLELFFKSKVPLLVVPLDDIEEIDQESSV